MEYLITQKGGETKKLPGNHSGECAI